LRCKGCRRPVSSIVGQQEHETSIVLIVCKWDLRQLLTEEFIDSDQRGQAMEKDICSEIQGIRPDITRCHIIKIKPLSLSDLAPKFGLLFTPNTYHEINREQAKLVVKKILYYDFAHYNQMMPKEKAEDLANRYFNFFNGKNVKYYTNGDYYKPLDHKVGHTCMPATIAATTLLTDKGSMTILDTGVLLIDELLAGCIWVEVKD
jgi:hypothetical protein